MEYEISCFPCCWYKKPVSLSLQGRLSHQCLNVPDPLLMPDGWSVSHTSSTWLSELQLLFCSFSCICGLCELGLGQAALCLSHGHGVQREKPCQPCRQKGKGERPQHDPYTYSGNHLDNILGIYPSKILGFYPGQIRKELKATEITVSFNLLWVLSNRPLILYNLPKLRMCIGVTFCYYVNC